MTPDDILGAHVVATNERGGKFWGKCMGVTLWGEAVVEVEAIDIGWGLETLPHTEERVFPMEQVEAMDE